MKTSGKTTGALGEDIACRFLTSRGQSVIERNWRWGHLEIDIITIDGEGLHFVEVKSRKAPLTADPLDNITTTKMHRIAAAANGYLHSAGKKAVFGTDLEVFFDVVTVVFEGKGWTVEYFPKSYTPVYL